LLSLNASICTSFFVRSVTLPSRSRKTSEHVFARDLT
jgi:hypothetical protein